MAGDRSAPMVRFDPQGMVPKYPHHHHGKQGFRQITWDVSHRSGGLLLFSTQYPWHLQLHIQKRFGASYLGGSKISSSQGQTTIRLASWESSRFHARNHHGQLEDWK